MFWIHLNPCFDEYADTFGDGATGLFTAGGFCLIGVEHSRYPGGGYRYGLIIMNIGFGIWKES
jgi:hypothetical protein